MQVANVAEVLVERAVELYLSVDLLRKENQHDLAHLIEQEADQEMTASVREEMKQEGLL